MPHRLTIGHLRGRIELPGAQSLTSGVILMAVALALPALPLWRAALLVAEGTALLGVMSRARQLPHDSPRRRLVLGVGLALGAAIVMVSEGSASLAITPLISGLVTAESVSVGVVTGALFVALIAGLESRLGFDLLTLAERTGANAAALVFVVVFTRLAGKESRARAESERLAEILRVAHEQLRMYAARVEDVATERERNRIAREIHDGLGHSLTIVAVQLEAARMLVASDPTRALGCIERAQSVNRNGLADVRASVAVLREPGPPLASLAADLAALVGESQASGLSASLAVEGQASEVSARVRATLFRTAQEGLTNVRRHAPGATARLELRFGECDIALAVLALGGTVRIRTGLGTGLHLHVQVPG